MRQEQRASGSSVGLQQLRAGRVGALELQIRLVADHGCCAQVSQVRKIGQLHCLAADNICAPEARTGLIGCHKQQMVAHRGDIGRPGSRRRRRIPIHDREGAGDSAIAAPDFAIAARRRTGEPHEVIERDQVHCEEAAETSCSAA